MISSCFFYLFLFHFLNQLENHCLQALLQFCSYLHNYFSVFVQVQALTYCQAFLLGCL